MNKSDIPSVIETTAKNMYELLMQLADHIKKLEEENERLKIRDKSDKS